MEGIKLDHFKPKTNNNNRRHSDYVALNDSMRHQFLEKNKNSDNSKNSNNSNTHNNVKNKQRQSMTEPQHLFSNDSFISTIKMKTKSMLSLISNNNEHTEFQNNNNNYNDNEIENESYYYGENDSQFMLDENTIQFRDSHFDCPINVESNINNNNNNNNTIDSKENKQQKNHTKKTENDNNSNKNSKKQKLETIIANTLAAFWFGDALQATHPASKFMQSIIKLWVLLMSSFYMVYAWLCLCFCFFCFRFFFLNIFQTQQ